MVIQKYYPWLGGAERQLQRIAPLLQADGAEIRIFTRSYPDLPRFEEIDGIPVVRLPAPRPKPLAAFTFTTNAVREIRVWKPDIIHAHALFSTTTTAVLAKAVTGAPVVAKVLRGGYLGDVQRLKRKLGGRGRMALLRSGVDAFITISKEIDGELAAAGVPNSRRSYIPNGIDTDHFAPATPELRERLREQFGLGTQTVAIFTGRLAAEKGLDGLLAVWTDLRRTRPDATLLIAGTGPEEAKLRRIAGEGVRFLGMVDDVVPYLQASDLFILPSNYEGLSNALLEAMACGLAVVATDVGGAPDLIRSGLDGELIQPGDGGALQTALETLLSDKLRRTALGARARDRIQRDFTLHRAAERLMWLYGIVIEQRGNAAGNVTRHRA